MKKRKFVLLAWLFSVGSVIPECMPFTFDYIGRDYTESAFVRYLERIVTGRLFWGASLLVLPLFFAMILQTVRLLSRRPLKGLGIIACVCTGIGFVLSTARLILLLTGVDAEPVMGWISFSLLLLSLAAGILSVGKAEETGHGLTDSYKWVPTSALFLSLLIETLPSIRYKTGYMLQEEFHTSSTYVPHYSLMAITSLAPFTWLFTLSAFLVSLGILLSRKTEKSVLILCIILNGVSFLGTLFHYIPGAGSLCPQIIIIEVFLVLGFISNLRLGKRLPSLRDSEDSALHDKP